MTFCTAPDCYRETTLFLCTDCIVELDALLQDVPALLSMIDGAIEQTAVTRNPGSGGSSNPAGSKPAANLDAMMLKVWLGQLPERAHTVAADNPKAGE